ncbi:MAG TPA: phosphotransferase, partial [Clostridia bacterium]|nr:phosphotransferase [Clostridia bacterium]
LCGKGYGNFQKLLDGYPADSLSESIPRFHDTNDRFKKFVAALKADPMGRVKEVSAEIDFFLSRKGYCKKITSLIASGDMPLRVTHNDTKLNNVLIDLGRDEFAAVIDLDTVMPGSIVYDFGDGIRSGANTGAEDERDLSLVNFNMEMYKAYTRGFMEEVAPVLAPSEIENMAFGALLMTFECGMRFLTDHIEGDKYFRIHREGHNLDRARTQIKMVTEMENKINDMNEIVRYYAVENQNSRIHQD